MSLSLLYINSLRTFLILADCSLKASLQISSRRASILVPSAPFFLTSHICLLVWKFSLFLTFEQRGLIYCLCRSCSVMQHVFTSAQLEGYWSVLCPVRSNHAIAPSFFPIKLTFQGWKQFVTILMETASLFNNSFTDMLPNSSDLVEQVQLTLGRVTQSQIAWKLLPRKKRSFSWPEGINGMLGKACFNRLKKPPSHIWS